MNNTEDRISRLNQKLKKIEVVDRGGRLSKLATLESRICTLEHKFEQIRASQEGESKSMKQQANKIIGDVEESNEFFASNYNVGKLVDVVSIISQRVEEIADSNRQSDQKLMKALDDKTKTIRNELAKERKSRNDAVDELCLIIKDSFPKLQEMVSEESSRRSESDESILKKLNQEVSDLDLDLSKERASKEENEKTIFEVIKDTVERVKKELETEKRDRENSEQSLSRLLEESMSKLNSIVQT